MYRDSFNICQFPLRQETSFMEKTSIRIQQLSTVFTRGTGLFELAGDMGRSWLGSKQVHTLAGRRLRQVKEVTPRTIWSTKPRFDFPVFDRFLQLFSHQLLLSHFIVNGFVPASLWSTQDRSSHFRIFRAKGHSF